jgi:hypothetical protein
VRIEEMEDTALHELAHLFQYSRRDARMTQKIAGRTIFEWDMLLISGIPIKKSVRRRVLPIIYSVELEAELYSIDMRRRMGTLRKQYKEIRRSTRTLMEYVLRFHFDIQLNSIAIKRLFNTTELRLTREIPSLEEMIAAIQPQLTN